MCTRWKAEAPAGQLVEGHRGRQGLRGRLVLQVPLGHQVHARRVLPRHKLGDDLQQDVCSLSSVQALLTSLFAGPWPCVECIAPLAPAMLRRTSRRIQAAA
jgi:hypothetical protein